MSKLPDARYLPSGENATEYTGSVCFVSVWMHRPLPSEKNDINVCVSHRAQFRPRSIPRGLPFDVPKAHGRVERRRRQDQRHVGIVGARTRWTPLDRVDFLAVRLFVVEQLSQVSQGRLETALGQYCSSRTGFMAPIMPLDTSIWL